MTPDANDLCVFAVKRGDVNNRLDVKHSLYSKSKHNNSFGKVPLGELTDSEPCYGTSATAIERISENQPKYIRITDFGDYGIEVDHKYMTAESYCDKHLLRPNDILFARSGATVGKTYYYDGSIGKAVFAGYCIRFRFDESKVDPKYVYWYTKTSFYKNWVNGIQRPSGQPNINKEEYKSLEIYCPKIAKQRELVDFLDYAFSAWQSKKNEADELLNEFENKLTTRFKFQTQTKAKICFAVRYNDIDGVIDVKRYSKIKNTQLNGLTVDDICNIVGDKVNVQQWGNQVIDWIRIDDLPNKPLDIEEIRTQSANEINGTFFEVQEGDILVARLGPTIQNQKIVMVRSLKRTTIASAEFLVLRCKPGYAPEAIMAILKTAYYRDLMYSKARGSTPSRYRLNREDLLKLPFPDIVGEQDLIAKQAIETRNMVKKMRAEAELEWEAAKEQFEKELLTEY